MTLKAWLARHDKALLLRRCQALALVAFTSMAVGGGWYLYTLIANGSLIGGDEFVQLAQNGGLSAHAWRGYSLYQFLRDVVAMVAGWSWAGSWSLVRVSPVLHLPLLLLAAWLVLGYACEARRHPVGDPIWLPTWLAGLFIAGMIYHLFVARAVGDNGASGWYLQILAPFLAIALGYGIEYYRKSTLGRFLLSVFLLYATFFLAGALWSQIALFAGCAIKDDQKYYKFAGNLFCLDRLHDVANNLSVLGWPTLALVSFGSGFSCLIMGLALFLRRTSNPGAV